MKFHCAIDKKIIYDILFSSFKYIIGGRTVKFYFITDKTSMEMKAIREVLPILKCEDDASGIPVYLQRIPEGLSVKSDDKGYTIGYSSRSALVRAVGLLVENIGKGKLDIFQKPRFDVLGTMPDHSRNAVQRIDTLERFIAISALMGFNSVMLYTEDTYPLEDEPHFGYMRGGLDEAKIKTLNKYADMMGVELVPCIQTLAHLPTIFQWREYAPINDIDDILLAEDENTYKLIDKMLDSVAKNFTSRKVVIGMDEAQHLGSGKYLKKHGFVERSEIMKKHMEIVVEKCKARGLMPQMWSDMFFRMQSKTYTYYDMTIKKMQKKIVNSVPKELTLLYWDYYSVDKARYDFMFERHNEFNNPIGFAGGSCCWYGVVPLSTFAVNSSRTAIESALEHGIKQAWVTMWGDDGAVCSLFTNLPTMQVYAEGCWAGNTSEKHLEKRFNICTGASFKDFKDMEQPENIPGRVPAFGEDIKNPTKYMFYQDILSGKFDRHIPKDISKHFARKTELMKKLGKRNGDYAYIFKTLEKLCFALEIKADLGVRLKEAYDKKDKTELSNLANKTIPELIKRIEQYYEALREQWFFENRPFGFEVQDVRLGGLMQRCKNARFIINRYLDGKTPTIPELVGERIVYDERHPDEIVSHIHRWNSIYTSNVTPD